MKPFSALILCAASLASTACIKISPAIPSWPAAPQENLTLTAADGFIVEAQINGQPVRLRVETGYSGVILNPAVAARLGLQKSMWENDVLLGPIRIQGDTAVAPLVIGAAKDDRRIIWFEKDIASGADGIINIASLPYATVTLQLSAPTGTETVTQLRTTPNRFWSVVHNHQAGERGIEVRYLLEAPKTLVTAAAGAQLASHHGGAWAGDAFEHRIGFDILRPVRPMRFAAPVSLGTVTLRDALVRTADFRGGYALPTDAPDPGEIVVTGPGQKSRPLFTAIIGRDHLSACSSITYDTRQRLLTLRCRPERPSP